MWLDLRPSISSIVSNTHRLRPIASSDCDCHQNSSYTQAEAHCHQHSSYTQAGALVGAFTLSSWPLAAWLVVVTLLRTMSHSLLAPRPSEGWSMPQRGAAAPTPNGYLSYRFSRPLGLLCARRGRGPLGPRRLDRPTGNHLRRRVQSTFVGRSSAASPPRAYQLQICSPTCALGALGRPGLRGAWNTVSATASLPFGVNRANGSSASELLPS